MLEPQDRRLLMEALQPPVGYTLDFAVSTTFSLDLLALLVAPMAFTFFDCETEDGKPDMEPMALLQALRRNAGKMAVFCQAGQIKVPPKDQRLFACLENSVHQVVLPNTGVFHPKLWLLRFTGQDSVMYRCICSSRNLTFDRSWDTLLVLEGDLRQDRSRGLSINRPLGDFIAQLPLLAQKQQDPTMAPIAQMAEEVRRVEFAAPEGLELARFIPLGIPGYKGWPFSEARERFLIVSPFLEHGLLERLATGDHCGVLVSRSDCIDALRPETLARFEEILVFDPGVQEASIPEDEPVQEPVDDHGLLGLHAKLFVADDGWSTRIWTGSANATNAAFANNVEFVVELRGRKSKCGIDAALGDETNGLRKLLVPWKKSEPDPDRELQRRFDEQALAIRLAMARAGLSAQVETAGEENVYCVELTASCPDTLQELGCSISCWPITTAAESMAQTIGFTTMPLARFPRISFEGLTPFFAFRAVQNIDGCTRNVEFVLKLDWQGAPEDRQEKLLRQIITNGRDFLAYLLLLADPGDAQGGTLRHRPSRGKGGDWQSMFAGMPVFEALLRCLDRSPEKLDEIAVLVADLSGSGNVATVIPERFGEIWEPVWRARQLQKETI